MDVLDRLAAANPMPDGASKPESIMSAAALRNVIDDRRGTMQTHDIDKVATTEPPAPRRRGLLVAAAAFATVVAVGIGIALITNAGSEPEQDVIDSPPTTAVAPTTEAAPPTTVTEAAPSTTVTEAPTIGEADLAFVAAYVDAYNSGDVDRYEALFTESTTLVMGDRGGRPSPNGNASGTTFNRTLESWLNKYVWEIAIGSQLELSSCTGDSGVIRCRADYTDIFIEPLMGVASTNVELVVAEGAITVYRETAINGSVLDNWQASLFDWVQGDAVAVGNALCFNSLEPISTPECAAEWTQLVPQYLEYIGR
jgi:hypothetical protein